ncbi:MAG TPA: GGDEF domain-containing protein [Gaiellaceae bacterium]|nr:GGDEF domain-containing protein [Gaiellaceae bacterium]
MADDASNFSASRLLAVLQMLLAAQELDDVRAAIGHGARLVGRFETLTLYEVVSSDDLARPGGLEATFRRGEELPSWARAVEELLRDRVSKTGRTASTLDRFAVEQEQELADAYLGHGGLCLARPLRVYGAFLGVLVLHFGGRTALADAEFDSLRRFVEFAAVALSNARTRAELRGFAYSDPLTGLANRRRLEVEFARLQGSQLSLLLVDFDGLKAVNDSLGYHRGDALIAAVGEQLASSAQPDEFVVRYGGDEFVVVMPGTARENALARAEQLTRILDQLPLPDDLGALFRGASVGYATAAEGDDLWQALERASAEMRSRKRRRKTDRELLDDEGAAELRFG